MISKDIKNQFPIFKNYRDNNFLYLDSASTTLKHKFCISKLNQYNEEYSANIHRSVYPIAEKATNEFESTRFKVWMERMLWSLQHDGNAINSLIREPKPYLLSKIVSAKLKIWVS